MKNLGTPKMITPLRSFGAALAMTLAASAALAQTAPPPVSGYGPPEHQRMQAMMHEHREAMSRDLHAILNIRPDQEGAFAAFQSSMMGEPRPERERRGGQEALTTPQRLDQMLGHMDERMTHMRARAQATKTFYAALTPEQQRAFDALERMHHRHGGHGWGGGPRGAADDGHRPPPPPAGE